MQRLPARPQRCGAHSWPCSAYPGSDQAAWAAVRPAERERAGADAPAASRHRPRHRWGTCLALPQRRSHDWLFAVTGPCLLFCNGLEHLRQAALQHWLWLSRSFREIARCCLPHGLLTHRLCGVGAGHGLEQLPSDWQARPCGPDGMRAQLRLRVLLHLPVRHGAGPCRSLRQRHHRLTHILSSLTPQVACPRALCGQRRMCQVRIAPMMVGRGQNRRQDCRQACPLHDMRGHAVHA